ncbi:hypothetical protein NDU88_002795 [Pleurodeles waltl]|uniref:Uncharacterized protein n=1 Tax=Pleurodeles waltl TaxID=8319 RepID=A0AAV7KWT1_PLEWA|nr:hypothetical protein NDU88_002795 [Pleurodeles waltl]
MTSTGRRGRRGRAADASSRLCGGVGDTPPGTAAWEEQRLGSVKTWGYDSDYAGGARGIAQKDKRLTRTTDDLKITQTSLQLAIKPLRFLLEHHKNMLIQ